MTPKNPESSSVATLAMIVTTCVMKSGLASGGSPTGENPIPVAASWMTNDGREHGCPRGPDAAPPLDPRVDDEQRERERAQGCAGEDEREAPGLGVDHEEQPAMEEHGEPGERRLAAASARAPAAGALCRARRRREREVEDGQERDASRNATPLMSEAPRLASAAWRAAARPLAMQLGIEIAGQVVPSERDPGLSRPRCAIASAIRCW